MSSKQKKIIITEGGVSWGGFTDLYQILGFIDVHCDPEEIRQAILANVKQGSGEQTQKE